MEAARIPWPALGMLLIRDGLVTSEVLEEVLAGQGDDREQRISSQRLGEALVANGTVTSAQIARLVAEQHELPFVDLQDPDAIVPVPVRLPEDVARSHCALPIRAFPDGSVLVVIGDPTLPRCFDDVRAALGVPVRFAVAAPDAIAAAIETVAESTALAEAAGDEDAHEGEPPAPEIDADDLVLTAPEERSPEPRATVSGAWPLLGSLLLRDELVSADELYAVLAQQRLSSTKRLGEILVARGSLTEEQLSRALAEQHELPFVELRESEIDRAAASLLPRDVARAHLALPISHVDGALLVVVADPASAVHADELRAALGVPLQFAVALSEDIDAAIESLVNDADQPVDDPSELVEEESELPPAEFGPSPMPNTNGREEPSARPDAVNDVLETALSLGATAVHFTRGRDGLIVRARIDGTMTDLQLLTDAEADESVATLAELAIAGRDTLVANDQIIELRPTTLPSTLGLRTTFRVISEEPSPPAFDDVFPEDVGHTLRDALARHSGLVIICGPASESRARALRTTMRELVAPERLILSVEDPVEFLVPGVGQTEVDALSGLRYPAALQAILRSDPDVAVVAELLDHETARLAVQGARDRLVLTTLDAPTSASAIRQLIDFGIAPRALSETIAIVTGHAAVRRLCDACRESYYASEDELVDLGRPLDERGRRLLGRGRGCSECGGTGYRHSIDLFEALPVAAELRAAVARSASSPEIEQVAIGVGTPTLRGRAFDLCLDGLTATEELRGLGLAGRS